MITQWELGVNRGGGREGGTCIFPYLSVVFEAQYSPERCTCAWGVVWNEASHMGASLEADRRTVLASNVNPQTKICLNIKN